MIVLDYLARIPRRRYAKLPTDSSNESWPDLAVARYERARTSVRVLPGFVWAVASRDLGAALNDEVPLEVSSLQLASFDELGGCPAFAGDRLASLSAQIERLTDRGPYHLASLVQRPALGLDLGQLRNVRVDEASLVAFEDGVELVGTHR